MIDISFEVNFIINAKEGPKGHRSFPLLFFFSLEYGIFLN